MKCFKNSNWNGKKELPGNYLLDAVGCSRPKSGNQEGGSLKFLEMLKKIKWNVRKLPGNYLLEAVGFVGPIVETRREEAAVSSLGSGVASRPQGQNKTELFHIQII